MSELRTAWMRETGRDVYTRWFSAVVEIGSPSVRPTLERLAEDEVGVLPTLGTVIDSNLVGFRSLADMQGAHDILRTHSKEILRYTAAASNHFMKNDKDAVVEHAWDGFKFAAEFSAGLAMDIIRERRSVAGRDELRTQFTQISTLLDNEVVIHSLDAASLTGFAVLGTSSTRLDEHGWQSRARSCGLEASNEVDTPPFSIMSLDEHGEPQGLRPEVLRYLHDALRAQNRQGLSAEATAGDMAELTTPISMGCPVRNTGAMALAAGLVSMELTTALELFPRD